MTDNETITKDKIAEMLQSNLGLSSLLCKEITTEFFNAVIELTKSEQKLMLKNFGKFIINHKESRPGRNIKTGGSVEVKPRNVLRFIPAGHLKRKINRINGGVATNE